MDIDITPLTAVAAIAAFLLAPAASVLIDALSGRLRWRSIAESAAVAASAGGCWMLVSALTRPELDARLILPIAGLAGLASVLTTVPLRRRAVGFVSVIAAVWTALVFAPAATALFSVTDGVLGSGLRTLDLGGSCAVLVTSGCGLVTALIVDRRAPVENPGRPATVGMPVFAALWVLWVLWLVGLELVVDTVTPRIIANAVIAPLASMSGWLVVQRVRHARTTAPGAVGGLFCGLVAVTAGCGYLDPLGAILTGGIAGVTCSLVGYGLVRRTGRTAWLLAIVLSVGASVGIVLLGVFATRSGLMFTGQPEVLFSQFASVVLVIAYAATLSLLLWLAVRQLDARLRRSAASRAA